jgi:hypothetical protein
MHWKVSVTCLALRVGLRAWLTGTWWSARESERCQKCAVPMLQVPIYARGCVLRQTEVCESSAISFLLCFILINVQVNSFLVPMHAGMWVWKVSYLHIILLSYSLVHLFSSVVSE